MKALDHDMNVEATLAPFGILEVASALLTITFGTSREILWSTVFSNGGNSVESLIHK